MFIPWSQLFLKGYFFPSKVSFLTSYIEQCCESAKKKKEKKRNSQELSSLAQMNQYTGKQSAKQKVIMTCFDYLIH